jgi:hypothetical protein
VPYNRQTNGRFLYRPVLDFRITLEARNPARRCSRQYRVEAGTDLLGSWVVEISYGHIGTAGRSPSFVVRDEGEARHLAQSILKRRAIAPRRIGIAYHIRHRAHGCCWDGGVKIWSKATGFKMVSRGYWARKLASCMRSSRSLSQVTR